MPNQTIDSIQAAKAVLEMESNALQNTSKLIGISFSDAINAILESKGRLVITGIGKSAHIGQKICSTLNSTGTPSLFMHAAEALHGDLGMIQKEDVIIVISNSGNTPEIKALLPILKIGTNPIIAICGNMNSTLGQYADYFLDSSVEMEACPNNLAPTTSTTVQLALGDALAVTLLKHRNFTSTDFAKFHPGGALGKKLFLKVEDIYLNNERPSINKEASLKEVIIEISSKRLGTVVVEDENQEIEGIITDGDLRRFLSTASTLEGIKAKDILTKNPTSISPEVMATEALKIMREKKITQIIVSQNKKYLGIIHIHDLNKEGIIN